MNKESVALEDVVRTAELARRTPPPPNLPAELEALTSLSQQMTGDPHRLLSSLTETALRLCRAGSAGVSLFDRDEQGEEVFRWITMSGAMASSVGGTTPRHFSPCGTCVDLNAPQLYSHPERLYTYFQGAKRPLVEGLVIPLKTVDRTLGTLWIVSHTDDVKFTREDVRIMTNLAGFSAAAVVMIENQTKTEASRREAITDHHRVSDILESITDAFVALDKDWRIIYVNAEAARLNGKKAEDFLGKSHWEEWPASRGTDVERQYRRAVADKIAVHFDHHYRDARRDLWLEIHAYPLREGGLALYYRDITERKKIEEALRASELQFADLVNAIPQLAWMADADGYLFWYNQRWYDYTGKTPADMEGWGWQSVQDPRELPRVVERWKTALAAGEAWEDTFPLRAKDGTFRWFLSRAFPIRDSSGKITRWLGTNTDITDQRETEARLEQRVRERTEELLRSQEALIQSQKMEAVGRLAGGVAHDFNNLLTGILGISQEIQGSFAPDDARRQDIDEIIKASNRAFNVTKQLLSFARQQVAQPTRVDVNAVVHDVQRLLQRLIGEDIALNLQLNKTGPIQIDPGHLEQVLLNLAINARDAMPKGGTITIKTEEVRRELQDFVVMRFSDTGVGMGADVLGHIFEPFFTTKAKEKGTGLGLSTVYGIVKQNGGDIKVTSAPGKGTTFRLRWPVTTATLTVPEGVSGAQILYNGNQTILVVEDEDIVRKVVVRKLVRKGYQVLAAHNGKEALAIAEQHRGSIDLILTDVVMPGMNGKEAVDQLRLKYPKAAVLYMSGYSEDIIAHRGILEPGIDFIDKTSLNTMLVQKAHEVLAKRRG